MFSDQQTKELNKKLDPACVQKPTGQFGPKGDYIEGWHAIAEANRIFGFDGWSYRIDDLKQCGETYENAKGNSIVSYIATVTITVMGEHLSRQDVGYGSGASKQVGDAHEGATKEAVTDALKRALRTFGNQFGLALYDKTRENVGVDVDPEDEAKMLAEVGKATTDMLNCESKSELRDFLVGAKEKLNPHYYSEIKREATKLAEDLPEKAQESIQEAAE